MTQPLDFTLPRFLVTNGVAATISDTSDRAFAFGDGDLIQGKRAAVERKVTEGMKIEATVIAQDENHVVLDLAVELSSADAPAGEAAPLASISRREGGLTRPQLDKPVKFAAREWRVEATVSAVFDKDADARPLREEASNTAAIGRQPRSRT